MKFGVWSQDRDTLRRDGLVLFGKLIRTKNVDNLQEQQPRTDDRKQKLTVSWISDIQTKPKSSWFLVYFKYYFLNT